MPCSPRTQTLATNRCAMTGGLSSNHSLTSIPSLMLWPSLLAVIWKRRGISTMTRTPLLLQLSLITTKIHPRSPCQALPPRLHATSTHLVNRQPRRSMPPLHSFQAMVLQDMAHPRATSVPPTAVEVTATTTATPAPPTTHHLCVIIKTKVDTAAVTAMTEAARSAQTQATEALKEEAINGKGEQVMTTERFTATMRMGSRRAKESAW